MYSHLCGRCKEMLFFYLMATPHDSHCINILVKNCMNVFKTTLNHFLYHRPCVSLTIYSGKQRIAWEQPKDGPAGLKHKHMHKHKDMHTQTSEVIGNKSNSQLRDVFYISCFSFHHLSEPENCKDTHRRHQLKTWILSHADNHENNQ